MTDTWRFPYRPYLENRGAKVAEPRRKKFTFTVEVGGNLGEVLGGYTKPTVRFEADDLDDALRNDLMKAAAETAGAAFDAILRQEQIRASYGGPH